MARPVLRRKISLTIISWRNVTSAREKMQESAHSVSKHKRHVINFSSDENRKLPITEVGEMEGSPHSLPTRKRRIVNFSSDENRQLPITEVGEMEESPQSLPTRKRGIINFSSDEKRQLANEVKGWPRIWNISDPLHSNKNAVDQAWLDISNTISKPVSECKSAWVSMRESYRYHARVAQKGKSGSAGGEILDTPSSENIDWEFAEEMAFLPNVSHKRKTFITPLSFGENSSPSPINVIDDPNVSLQNASDSQHSYDYNPTPTSNSRSSTPQIWSRFDNILKKQEEMLETRSRATSTSPYAQALSSFDWLLNQLPRYVGDNMCLEINLMLLRKVEEHKANK